MPKKKDTKLHPTKEEIAYHKSELIPIIRGRLGKEDVEDKVDDIIQSCIEGWPKAPKSFAARIQKRAKLYGTDGENLQSIVPAKKGRPAGVSKVVNHTAEQRKSKRVEAFTKSYASFTERLNDVQKAYFADRLDFYLSEFDFNMSSDLSLLMQLIMNELHISELQIDMVKIEEARDKIKVANAIDTLTNNVINVEKILGITREQRQKGMGGKEGSVAQVSMLYEDKINKIELIKKREREQGKLLLDAKKKKGDINLIPESKQDLQDILNADEELQNG